MGVDLDLQPAEALGHEASKAYAKSNNPRPCNAEVAFHPILKAAHIGIELSKITLNVFNADFQPCDARIH